MILYLTGSQCSSSKIGVSNLATAFLTYYSFNICVCSRPKYNELKLSSFEEISVAPQFWLNHQEDMQEFYACYSVNEMTVEIQPA